MTILTVHGIDIPRVGFGTWRMTGADAYAGVRHALELGYRHIDTARAYGNEREVGRALRDSGLPRGEIFVTTKVWLDDVAPERARASAEASLRDLGLDHVDLLLQHWPNPDVAVEDSVGALEELRQEGRTRLIGVSNFPPGLFRRALEIAPVATNQVEFHPLLGQDELLAIARQAGISITAYSPLAQGDVARDRTLAEIGERHGRSAGQVALRYLLDKPGTIVLPKSSSERRRAENLAIFDFELTAEDRARVDALPKDRRQTNPSWAPKWDE